MEMCEGYIIESELGVRIVHESRKVCEEAVIPLKGAFTQDDVCVIAALRKYTFNYTG